MLRALAFLLLLLLHVACVPHSPASSSPRRVDTITLTFLATTDIHGHVEAEVVKARGKRGEARQGGLPLVAGYVANARAANPGRVVLLDAGDMLQGTLVSNLGEGRAVVKAMNAMGYAAAALGNHEFDFGPVGPAVVASRPDEDPRGALAARAAEATYPWLCANIADEEGRPPVPGVTPFVVVDVDGVKVGIVGGTSEDTPFSTQRPNLRGLRVEPLAPALVRAAQGARAAGATVVVAVVHEGGECRRNDDPEDLASCRHDSPIWKVARALPPGTLDAIFAGHTHQAVAHRVAGVPILQAWANARAISRLDLTVDRRSGRPMPGGARIYPPEDVCATRSHGHRRCEDPSVPPGTVDLARYEGRPVVADARVAAAFAEDVRRAADKMAEPVAVTLGHGLHRHYGVESALGDLAADALRHAGRADVGLVNGGGLRANLPAGPLAYGALFEAFPFDNRLVVVRLRGAALRRLLARNLRGDKGIFSVSGLTVRAACRGRALDLNLTLEDGRPLDDMATYSVATIDFLVRGGDGFAHGTRATSPPVIDEDGPLLRDLVADELRRRGPHIEGDAAVHDPAHPRMTLPGPRPVRCAKR